MKEHPIIMNNTTYEFFIRRYWKCERFKNGADAGIWDSLSRDKYSYDQSIGKPPKSQEDKLKKDYEKRLLKVKVYIEKAYEKLLDRVAKDRLANNYDEEMVKSLSDLRIKASISTTPQDLFLVLKYSM